MGKQNKAKQRQTKQNKALPARAEKAYYQITTLSRLGHG
jgi:hypothetical protein